MTTPVRELMTVDPTVLRTTDSAQEAARRMRDGNVGAIIVEENGAVRGIVTDRDLVTRVMADTIDAAAITVGEIATGEVRTLAPDAPLSDAIAVMRDDAVTRIPIVEDGTSVGILSLGDLAEQRDPSSLLGHIADAPPNA